MMSRYIFGKKIEKISFYSIFEDTGSKKPSHATTLWATASVVDPEWLRYDMYPDPTFQVVPDPNNSL